MAAMTTPAPSARPDQSPISRDQLAWLEQQADHLQVAAEHELRAAGACGLTELALIRALQSPRWELIESLTISDPTALYHVHFLQYHALYLLLAELAQDGEKLVISPLRLCILSIASS